MKNENLETIFKAAYETEYGDLHELSHSFYEKARDKTYALKLGLGMISLTYLFRNATDLDKSINDLYEHGFKLGISISEIICEAPQLINEYLLKKAEHEKNKKNEISIEWKKYFNIIPYKIKTVNIKGALRAYSPFEELEKLEDIAIELGKLRAVFDIRSQLIFKLSAFGVVFESENSNQIDGNPLLLKLKNALENNDLDIFFETLGGLFSTFSYNMKITESYFHSLIHMSLKLSGIATLSELETNEGRIDTVTETENYIHIFEFKLTDSKEAIDQIKDKNYYQSFLNSSKKVILVGVAFDKRKRNIANWTAERFDMRLDG